MCFRPSSASSQELLPSTKIGICQIKVGANKDENIARAKQAISEAKSKGAELVILPECWNSPYSTASFPKYAEHVPNVGKQVDNASSPSVSMLCSIAKENNIWLIGGSIPERESVAGNKADKLYNTSLVIDSNGTIVGKHRKVHLFDIDIPGKITFRESDSLSPGQSITTVQTPWGLIGVGICYDLRFPELAIAMRDMGCKILLFPGAFNMITGPLHWELLQRARAVDNQVYVVTCSPARVKDSNGYVAYGHSNVISPMGEVIGDAGTDDNVIVVDINLQNVQNMRENIPCWKQKRHDLYTKVSKV